MEPRWILKKFDELTVHELYAILRLRNEVFAVEQNCVYADMDNKDQLSWHVMYHEDGRLLAYTRLVPPGVSYTYPSIGRVVTAMPARKRGLGRQLMLFSIHCCEKLFGKTPIQIGAQLYLKKFYESLGFRQTSDIYTEDGIKHVEMIHTPVVS